MATAAGPSAPVQTQRELQFFPSDPLKVDDLLLTGFFGQEQIARLFTFRLDLFSKKHFIDPKDIVGKRVTFSVLRHKAAAGSNGPPPTEPRFFNGFVNRFTASGTESGYRTYTAEVVPWLWFLTQTADCRIFQRANIPKIVEQIFTEHGFKGEFDSNNLKKEQYPDLEYCVQYRETDFNFVSRLMEQAGIYYYFKHEKDKHILVMGDDRSGYAKLSDFVVPFHNTTGGNVMQARITSWEHQYEFCAGKWAHADYNFKTANLELRSPASAQAMPIEDTKKYEVFDYPGEYENNDEGKVQAEVRMGEEETQYNQVRGQGYCRTFSPGGRFQLSDSRTQTKEDGTYLVTTVQHSAHEPSYGQRGGGEAYSNVFTAIPDSVHFRPARSTPKPLISGVQTAVVVGPEKEEIYTDKFGRVKVHFFWDREVEKKMNESVKKRKDDDKSCWIRVAHNIAGNKWGFFSIPRIGQEVVVDFLEGDPDRPLIVGSVYNSSQMPHYELESPADNEKNKTRSYIKTNSSKGGVGFNELRFDDKKDQEQIFVHAEKNMDVRVKNDSKETIYGNRHQTIGWEKDGKKGGDQSELVYQDKQLNVKRNQIEHIEGNYQLMVGNGDAADSGNVHVVVEKQSSIAVGPGGVNVNIDGDKKEKIDGGNSLTVAGPRNEKFGAHSLTVGMDQNTKVGMKSALEAGMEIHLKAGMKVIIEAGLQLTMKVGGNFVDIGPTGVTIQGTLVNINSGGAAGSGSGSKPEEPAVPNKADVQKAKPAKPAAADNSKSGQKSNSSKTS